MAPERSGPGPLRVSPRVLVMSEQETSGYLGAAQIREIAAGLGLRPTKQWGQNFVVDANTVKRIVRVAGVTQRDSVVEVGPGLGSLTLALLPEAGHVTAVEVDPALAAALPGTVKRLAPAYADRLSLVQADALRVRELPDPQPTALVANLPYNVSVPVVLGFLEAFPTLERVMVMVQLEVAERLAAGPGSKTYGVPSVKAAWYADVRLAGTVSRSVFWPVPNVDSGLVSMTRRPAPDTPATRTEVFACIDAAFAQRRKTLRAALAGWAGSAARAEEALRAAGIDPRTRGERLGIEDFARIAEARLTSQRGSG
jgi:16S rRNA (adenine1518-N6/adenine1519-N6)-dimethyltransferase